MAWEYAADRSALAGRDLVAATCGDRRLVLYALADGIFATADACPHQGAPLSAGCVVQGYVECPVHRALFDIRTGAPDGAVTARPVRTYPVKVEGDDIYVDVPGREEPQ